VIDLLRRTLDKLSDPYERYQNIFRELSFRCAEAREWQTLLDLLRRGQTEGLFYPFQTGERPWPAYVAEISRLEGFGEFMKENDRLRDKAQRGARLEYFVDKPADYTREKKYQLVLILHGGIGSHIALAENWHSARLASGCIVAHLQGAQYRGSFSRVYEHDSFAGVLTAYQHILKRYSVDESRIVLARQSDGGRSAILLAVNGRIQAWGLILAFPTKPRELEEQAVWTAARNGLRAVFLCGEKTSEFREQKQMAALFDRCALTNLFLAFPERGHEFPDGFPAHLDHSLDFIFGPAK
jgi:hypothetical protein